MSEVPPSIEFDEARAMRYSPIKELEVIRIIEKPADEVTVIENKLLGPQTVVGTYVEVLNPETNVVKGASEYDNFMDTHTPWEGVENGWYWSAPVDAYRADVAGELLTGGEGGTSYVEVGDWIFRDRNGEVSRISAEYFTQFYDLDSARPIPQEPE